MIEGTIFPDISDEFEAYKPRQKYSTNSTKTNYIESDNVNGKILLQDNMQGFQVEADQDIMSQLIPAVAGGTVSSPVGERQSVGAGYRATRPGYQMNSGADIVGGDENVRAMGNGTVVSVSGDGSKNDGFGNSVVLEHDINGQKVYSRYSHLASVSNIAPGQSIKQGTQIGIMGATGNVTGKHLDNEVYQVKNGNKYFQDTSSLY
jgi:murein DD-endopeptidase MepM/ murein hydrolase activator NlpD